MGGQVLPLFTELYLMKEVDKCNDRYGVPFVSKLTIQLVYILQVNMHFHGDSPVKQR